MPVLNYNLIGMRILDWLIALAVLIVTYGVLQGIRRLVLNQVERLSQRTQNIWNNFTVREVSQTRSFFLLALSFYIASLTLPLPAAPSELIKLLVEAAALLQIAIWGTNLIDFLIYNRMQSRTSVHPSTATSMNALSLIARVLLWVSILLILLENIPGVQVTSLIASLGITGIAVALAVQRILSDLFASLSITLDKPFVLGDFIIIDQFQGTVEKIGLKSTRLRSLDGEELIFSNSDLLNSRIHNYQRMTRRRVQFQLRVSVNTPLETLAEIPQIIQDSISGIEGVTFGRAHLKEINAAAYIFDVVFYVETADYAIYMDKQQAVNLQLLRQFQAANVQMAA